MGGAATSENMASTYAAELQAAQAQWQLEAEWEMAEHARLRSELKAAQDGMQTLRCELNAATIAHTAESKAGLSESMSLLFLACCCFSCIRVSLYFHSYWKCQIRVWRSDLLMLLNHGESLADS